MSKARELRSRTLDRIEKLQNEFRLNEKTIHNALLTALKGRIVRCKHCHKRSRLGRWGFIQTHWYESPYSCSGGDVWYQNETDECHIVCPECKRWNYVFTHPQKTLVVETLSKRGIYPSDIFAFVDKHCKDEWPLERVHPAQR